MFSYFLFLEKCILPFGETFFGITYTKYLKHFREILKNSEKDITDFQKLNLNEILQNAAKNSPYYQSLNIEIDTIDIFKSL